MLLSLATGILSKLWWHNPPQPSSQANINSYTSAIHETQYPFNEDALHCSFVMCFMANTFLEVRISHIILLTRGRNCRTSRGHSRFLQGRKSHTPFQLMRLHRLMFSSNFTGVNPCFGGCLLSGRSLLVSYLSRLVYSFECGHCDSQCVGERFSSCMHDYRACASASILSGGSEARS